MMAKKSEPGLIVGLDVGTSKIEAVVGELTEEGEIEIIGIGSSPSRGLKKGVVVNIESTVQSIQRAVEEAELMAGARSTRSIPGSPARTSRATTPPGWSRSRTARWSPAMWTG